MHDIYIFPVGYMHYLYIEKYRCHVFDSPVIISEGEIVFPDKFMTPTRKTSYCHHDTDEAVPVMVKFKKVVMPFI